MKAATSILSALLLLGCASSGLDRTDFSRTIIQQDGRRVTTAKVELLPSGSARLGEAVVPGNELAKTLKKAGIKADDVVLVEIQTDTPQTVVVKTADALYKYGYRNTKFSRALKVTADSAPPRPPTSKSNNRR